MKVRVDNQHLADAIARELGRNQKIFEAVENYCDWTDDDGVMYAYEVIVREDGRSMTGYWAHAHEVVVLKPGEELATLGHPNYSDDFAEEVLLYMVENDVSAAEAITIIEAKDISANTHRTRKKPKKPIPYRVQGGITEI